MLCGLLLYISVADPWKAPNDRAAGEQVPRPANPPVLPAPQKADADPGHGPGLSPQKPPRHVQRGPPNLQIRAPSKHREDRSQDDTKQREEALATAHQDEVPRRTVVSWRGAVIEPEQGTQVPSRKADAPTRPSREAPSLQNQAGAAPSAPRAPGHPAGEDVPDEAVEEVTRRVHSLPGKDGLGPMFTNTHSGLFTEPGAERGLGLAAGPQLPPAWSPR
ncbi:endoplasmic reticulum mannosyl-oligosaccharide 1,2-alpha-mannosidase-like [Molossus molossus]|uniref:endoplasmic reticulum mannosyl-oligosaccharide 1,2-alpha-mannosidase-like n=1 Tax=Molossus molossus TaxID=27622 RepID=UPI001745E455|nr:endoplasmic reticulum mannosyl-oligosaccharide 1,2-alpha-mannosidase-like [Molossus molossus]